MLKKKKKDMLYAYRSKFRKDLREGERFHGGREPDDKVNAPQTSAPRKSP